MRLAESNLTRRIYHYQYIGWPDHGCPTDAGEVLNFIERWNECAKHNCPPDMGPIVVHCSAGIGRTGTIIGKTITVALALNCIAIAIDLIVSQLKAVGLHATVDVARCVQMLREQRSGMVQTEQQYCFIYQALKAFIDVERQRLDNVSDFDGKCLVRFV